MENSQKGRKNEEERGKEEEVKRKQNKDGGGEKGNKMGKKFKGRGLERDRYMRF